MIFIFLGVLFFIYLSFCDWTFGFVWRFPLVFFRNIFNICKEAYRDFKNYINGVDRFVDYGYYIYGGAFGAGKTLNMVKHARRLIRYYSQWYDVVVWSNMELNFTKYNHFECFEDLERIPDENEIYIYLIDEAGSIFYSRNFAKSKLNEEEMVLALNQVRKDRKCVLMSSQRHKMLDAALRRVADTWYDVQKHWRFSFITMYDGYDLEYLDSEYIRPVGYIVAYASNRDRRAYNHTERIHMLDMSDKKIYSGESDSVKINVNKSKGKSRKRAL